MAKVDASTAPWEEADSATSEVASEFVEFADFSDTAASGEEYDDGMETIPPDKEPLIDEIANEFVGFWNLLVSRTNWEKGKVIHSWRSKLIEAKFPRRIYSDDSIAQRIGGVSPQHVGRLRRVYERFGEKETLPNLYWSHYQAALDWEDAEEWLQKASDEKWSVAQTRVARWEKYGAPLNHKPKETDIVDAEPDEDADPRNDSNAEYVSGSFESQGSEEEIHPSRVTASENDDDEKKTKKKNGKDETTKNAPLGEYSGEEEPWEKDTEEGAPHFTTGDVLDAMSKLEELPADLAEAFESIKIAILTRKLEKWTDVKPIVIASYLSELKRLLISEEK